MFRITRFSSKELLEGFGKDIWVGLARLAVNVLYSISIALVFLRGNSRSAR